MWRKLSSFTFPFIYNLYLRKYLLSTYYVPDSVPCIENALINEIDKIKVRQNQMGRAYPFSGEDWQKIYKIISASDKYLM